MIIALTILLILCMVWLGGLTWYVLRLAPIPKLEIAVRDRSRSTPGRDRLRAILARKLSQ